jgi:GNAT superfamily N-acetyltransferase
MNLTFRTAGANDLHWINERYREVAFLPSKGSDLVVVATVDGEDAAVGRLVPIEDDVAELGGILVFEAYRGRGIAPRLIGELISRSKVTRLYCIPFTKLNSLYAGCGFAVQDVEAGSVPGEIREKYDWCRREYAEPVTLMAKRVLSSEC